MYSYTYTKPSVVLAMVCGVTGKGVEESYRRQERMELVMMGQITRVQIRVSQVWGD